MTHTPSSFSAEKLARSADVLRAVAHPLRLQLLDYLRESNGATLQDIQESLDLDGTATGQHLRILRRAGIVSTARDGKSMLFQIEEERLMSVREAVERFASSDVTLA